MDYIGINRALAVKRRSIAPQTTTRELTITAQNGPIRICEENASRVSLQIVGRGSSTLVSTRRDEIEEVVAGVRQRGLEIVPGLAPVDVTTITELWAIPRWTATAFVATLGSVAEKADIISASAMLPTQGIRLTAWLRLPAGQYGALQAIAMSPDGITELSAQPLASRGRVLGTGQWFRCDLDVSPSAWTPALTTPYRPGIRLLKDGFAIGIDAIGGPVGIGGSIEPTTFLADFLRWTDQAGNPLTNDTTFLYGPGSVPINVVAADGARGESRLTILESIATRA